MTLRPWLLAATLLGAACQSSLPGEPVIAHDVSLRLERTTPRNGHNATVIVRNNAEAPRFYLTCGSEPLFHTQSFANGRWNDGPIPGCLEGGWVSLSPGEERAAHVSLGTGIHRVKLTITEVVPSESSQVAVSNAVEIRYDAPSQ